MSEKSSHLTPEDLTRIKDTSDFIAGLKPEVREFFLGLRKDEIDTAKRGLEMIRKLEVAGQVFKWVILTFMAAVIGAAAFGDAVMKVLAWFRVKG